MLSEKAVLQCLRVCLMGDSSQSSEDQNADRNAAAKNQAEEVSAGKDSIGSRTADSVCYGLTESLRFAPVKRLCLRLGLRMIYEEPRDVGVRIRLLVECRLCLSEDTSELRFLEFICTYIPSGDLFISAETDEASPEWGLKPEFIGSSQLVLVSPIYKSLCKARYLSPSQQLPDVQEYPLKLAKSLDEGTFNDCSHREALIITVALKAKHALQCSRGITQIARLPLEFMIGQSPLAILPIYIYGRISLPASTLVPPELPRVLPCQHRTRHLGEGAHPGARCVKAWQLHLASSSSCPQPRTFTPHPRAPGDSGRPWPRGPHPSPGLPRDRAGDKLNGKMEMDVEGVSPRPEPIPRSQGAGGACQAPPPRTQPQPQREQPRAQDELPGESAGAGDGEDPETRSSGERGESKR
ncbi:PREDICTED: uncharacterized protein LOC106148840 [Chinchilla lanigera]|uniref:uncharacterized protein LOC106148840 n=1 Tax=Chinchilla lanigera TaxID=34839 RepID=UPI000698EA06|nr:PREDICTED: uncharacterized protein LOC106148840 [Chinchilla lanigera]